MNIFKLHKLSSVLDSGLGLLTPCEKRRFFWVCLLSFVGGCIDVLSLMLIYPVISFLIDPVATLHHSSVKFFWNFLDEPDIKIFASVLVLFAGCLVTMGLVVNAKTQHLSNRFAANCQERLGKEIMTQFLNASYLWHLAHNPIVLSSVFQNHIVVWGRDVIRRIANSCSQFATALLPIIAFVTFVPLIATSVLLIIACVSVLILRKIRRKTTKLINDKRINESRLHVFSSETLQGIKEVILCPHKDTFIKKFQRMYHVTIRNYYSASNFFQVPIMLSMAFGQFAVLGFALVLYLNGVSGAELASTMAVVVLVASRVIPAMSRLGNSVSTLLGSMTSITDLRKISVELRCTHDLGFQVSDEKLDWSVITIDDVTFSYPGASAPSISNVKLELNNGSFYAFVGSSGAGKSTLVDLIIGVISPTRGMLKIDGNQFDLNKLQKWQASIGYVPQMPLILDSSLRENIAFGVKLDRIDDVIIDQCISLANLNDVVSGLPDGVNTKLGDRGARLSGGQRQRVAIARALYRSPSILILDEATSALDAISERNIRDSLEKLYGKITIISIAHRFSTIVNSDRIFLLEGGAITDQGSYEELLERNVNFRELATVY